MLRRKFKATFDYYGQALVAEATWDKGYPGSREEPPEPAGWEHSTITYQGVDILPFASDEVIAYAEEALDGALSVWEDNSYDERERHDEEIDNA